MTNRPSIQIAIAPAFRRAARRLHKKYRRLDQDLQPLIDQLVAGETPGDLLQGLAPYRIFKVRLRSSDLERGKSAGYRVIYYVQHVESVILVYIYIKNEQVDIRPDEIEQMVKDILKDL